MRGTVTLTVLPWRSAELGHIPLELGCVNLQHKNPFGQPMASVSTLPSNTDHDPNMRQMGSAVDRELSSRQLTLSVLRYSYLTTEWFSWGSRTEFTPADTIRPFFHELVQLLSN